MDIQEDGLESSSNAILVDKGDEEKGLPCVHKLRIPLVGTKRQDN